MADIRVVALRVRGVAERQEVAAADGADVRRDAAHCAFPIAKKAAACADASAGDAEGPAAGEPLRDRGCE